MASPYVKLHTGQEMPVVGLGTSKNKGTIIANAVESALEVGYRHFDCAYVYGNEAEIGKVLQSAVLEGIVNRDELFISGKLGCSFQHPDYVAEACERSLKNLHMEYFDLFYMHWPFGLKYDGPDNFFPKDDQGNLFYDESIDFVDTWHAMEELCRSGKTRAIGLCNFNIHQLKRLLNECIIPPAVHQFECHPYLCQDHLIEFCHSKNIAVVGYSPLCSSDRPNLPPNVSLFSEPVLKRLSLKYNATIGQIALRYQTQRGVAVIPRSSHKRRISENIKFFGFSLSDEDIVEIQTLNSNTRIMYPDKFSKHKHFPF